MPTGGYMLLYISVIPDASGCFKRMHAVCVYSYVFGLRGVHTSMLMYVYRKKANLVQEKCHYAIHWHIFLIHTTRTHTHTQQTVILLPTRQTEQTK